METQGRLEEGIAWMENSRTLGKLQPPVHTGGGIALLPREEEIQKVLELYDTYVWGP